MDRDDHADRATLAALFEPFSIKSLTLRNRIAMAPMGRHFSSGGIPSEAYVEYYARRAAGGAGLVTSEATPVPHDAAAHAATYSQYRGEGPLRVWGRVVAAVHQAGGAYMQQLFHIGGLRRPGDLPHVEAAPISPSGLFQPATGEGAPPQAMAAPATDEQLADVIDAFGQAAQTAQALGCDGVNLHGAHGYLLDQFFWSALNRRTDQYGGALRTRFAAEVVAECRRRVGPDFPIFLRISQWKQQDYGARLCETPQALAAFLAPLADAGVDLFDCSTRRFWQPEFEGSDLNLAGWVKKLSGRPTMTVGSVGLDRELMRERPVGDADSSDRAGGLNDFAAPSGLDRLIPMLERGDFDLVAVGRALLSNPRWVADVGDGRWDRIRPFEKAHLGTLE
jgi:2,4-dienoyl-CoA reductase-like NADH-dependent reductase (Old Yellow Enzyme family)